MKFTTLAFLVTTAVNAVLAEEPVHVVTAWRNTCSASTVYATKTVTVTETPGATEKPSAASATSSGPSNSFDLPPIFGSAVSVGNQPTATVLPVPNPNVNRNDIGNLKPSDFAVLNYAESIKPGSYAASINFTMTSPQVTLENSARIAEISHPGNTIVITFLDIEAFGAAKVWEAGVVLITNDKSCNPADQRGLYMVESLMFHEGSLTVTCTVTVKGWAEVAFSMQVSYGTVSQDQGSAVAQTTVVTSYYSEGTTMGSTTYLTNLTPIPIAMTTTQSAEPLSPSPTSAPSSGLTSSPSQSTVLPVGGGSQTGTAGASVSATRSTVITTTATAPFPTMTIGSNSTGVSSNTTRNSTLTPVQQSMLNEIKAGVTYAPDGNLVMNLGPLATMTPTFTYDTPDPFNATQQAAVQSLLAIAGFTDVDDLTQDSANSLIAAFSQAYGITPDMLVTEVFPSGFSLQSSSGPSATTTNSVATETPSPSVVPDKRGTSLAKRLSFSSLLGDINDFLTSDLVTAFCEACEDLSDIEDAYDAGVALYEMLNPSSTKIPIEEATGIVTGSVSLAYPTNSRVYNGPSNSFVNCVNCGIEVSSINLQGVIVCIIPANAIISAIITTTVSATSNAIMEITTTGQTTGNFDSGMNTEPLTQVSIPNIFVISPVFLFGMGASYDTDIATTFTAGASMVLNGATAELDVANGQVGKQSGWTPSVTITYPNFSGGGQITLMPYIKWAIQMSVQICGKTVQNAVSITSQTNIAFDTQVLTTQQTLSKRDIDRTTASPNPLHKRFSFSNIAAEVQAAAAQAAAEAAAALRVAAAPTCPAGGLLLTTSMTSTTNAKFDAGNAINLWNNSYPFGQRCFTVAALDSVTPTTSKTTTRTTTTMATTATTTSLSSATTRTTTTMATTATTTSLTSATTPSISVPRTSTLSTSTAVMTEMTTPLSSTHDTSSKTLPTSSVAVTTASSTTTSPSAGSATSSAPVIASSNCPSGYSAGLITESNQQFELACGVSPSGGSPFGTATEATFQGCLDWCISWGAGSCASLSWYPGGSQNCALFRPGVVTGTTAEDPSSSAVYAVFEADVTPPYCPSGYSSGQQVVEGGQTYELTCGTSVAGGSTFLASATEPTYLGCMDWCNSWGSASCVAFTYNTGNSQNCVLYSSTTGTAASTGNALSVIAPKYCPSGYNAGSFTDSGSSFSLACGTAVSSGESVGFLASAPETTYTGCLKWCESWGGACQAFMFYEAPAGNQQNCVLYNTKALGTGYSSGVAMTTRN